MTGAVRIILSQPLGLPAPKTASGGKIRAHRVAPERTPRNRLYRLRKPYLRGQTRVGVLILGNTIGNAIAGDIAQQDNTAAQGQGSNSYQSMPVTSLAPDTPLALSPSTVSAANASLDQIAVPNFNPVGMGLGWVQGADGSWFNQGAVNAAVDRIAASNLSNLGIDTSILAPAVVAGGTSVFQGVSVPSQSQAEARYAQIEISECKSDPIFSSFLSNPNTISMNKSMITATNNYNITQNVDGMTSIVHPEYEYIAGPATFGSGYDYSSLLTSYSNSSVRLAFANDVYALGAGVDVLAVPSDQIIIVHDHPGPDAMPGLSYGKGDDGQGSDIQTANSTGHSIIAYDFATKQYYCYNPSGQVKLK